MAIRQDYYFDVWPCFQETCTPRLPSLQRYDKLRVHLRVCEGPRTIYTCPIHSYIHKIRSCEVDSILYGLFRKNSLPKPWKIEMESVRWKWKAKLHPLTCYEGTDDELTYSSTLPLTSALYGSVFNATSGPLYPPGQQTLHPLYWLGGYQRLIKWVRKISPLPGFDPRTVQPLPIPTTLEQQTLHPLYRLGGYQRLTGWVRKVSPLPGFDPRTVQPVAIPTTLCRPTVVLDTNSSYSIQ